MKTGFRRPWVVGVLLGASACAGAADPADEPSDGSSGGHASSSSSSGGKPSGDAGQGSSGSSGEQPAAAVPLTELGIWTVSGTDARGAFTGELELFRASDDSLRFARTVSYAGVVENQDELHLAWTGTATDLDSDGVSLAGALDPRGFIAVRGDTVHTLGDAVVETAAQVVRGGDAIHASWTVGDATFTETWATHRASGAEPIFVNRRTMTPAYDPPSSATKSALFATYGEFQSQPLVAPYAQRTDFLAAVQQNVLDTTDADFYRAHPNALRVVDRPVDPISLQEADRRRSAYAPTLEAKAAAFDADMEASFLEDGLWFSPDSLGNGAPGDASRLPSGDGSLWTGSYVVSQVQRYAVTGSAQALANVEHSVSSMAKLQEITGDPTQFARTLRKAQPDLPGGWHRGTGDLADLDWLEGGNNDMFSGLVLTYTFAYPLLCQGALASTHDALCTRIRDNVDHLTDLAVASGSGNDLDANWLKSIVFPTDLGTRAKAEAAWTKEKVGNRFYAVTAIYGVGPDWSGTNLTFSGVLAECTMARKRELGGDALSELGSFIDRSQENLSKQRLATWELLRAMYGATPPSDEAVQDAKWRLREMPSPKTGVAINHAVSPEFSLAPYPGLPWKNDWNVPGNRLQSLYNYPLFEQPVGVFAWKDGLSFGANDQNRRFPGTDYLYLYWLARQAGIVAAGE